MNPEKIHPRLQAVLQAETGVSDVRELATRTDHRVPVICKYREADVATRRVQTLAARRAYRLVPAVALELMPADIAALSDDPEVDVIWYDEEVHTCLDVSVPKIKAPQVWDAGVRGAGIKIAVVDTGIDPNHPDFAGRIVAMTDFTGEGAADNHGHGTHVASIAAGSGAASGGKFVGVAPEALLLAAKVLRGNGSGRTSDVMAGVEWAVDEGAHVINLSLGSSFSCDGTDALSVLCNNAVAAGVVVCVAAGNAGPAARTVGSPGCASDVITVGASDDEDAVASFSSRGPTADGRVKPDVLFPGVNIVAARASGTSMGTPVDEAYTQASGTSMATPHAAGAAALLLAANPALTPAQVKEIFRQAAIDLGLDPNMQGAGRVDVLAAYQLAIGGAPTPPPTPTPPPEPPEPPTPPPTPPPGDGCLTAVVRMFGLGKK